MLTARSYVLLVLGACAGFLAPVAALNLQLAANNLRADKPRLASEWQQARRGVTYAPPISSNRPFKTLRINDRLPDIDTVIFGSSTAMSIREHMFPPGLRAYNFAQSGNGLQSVMGEADYMARRWSATIKYFLIPLDWSLGMLYEHGSAVPAELTPDAARAGSKESALPFLEQLRDALSLPRVRELALVVRDVLRSGNPLAAARGFFVEPAGAEYQCPDGTPARDFDTMFRGMCVGFRYDGSATFNDQKRVDPREIRTALLLAAAPSSKYSAALRRSRGEPDPASLDWLAGFARRVRANGGAAIFFLPPLLPGLEQELARAAHTRAAYARTKTVLREWAQRESVTVLDAGAAERYGCSPGEFIDPHHALPDCYEKVLRRFWREAAWQQGAGLYFQ